MTQEAPSTVTFTIDGKTVTAPKGVLLVEAARQVDLEIPVFCYHPKLKPVGACRMCLVQIEKMPRLQTACTTPVAQDMVVHTTTPEVVEAQDGVLELLLANHPLDCPICDKGGECPLQDNTFKYGPGASRFREEKRRQAKAFPLGPRIVLDRERCIMCFRCVRFQQEIVGDEQLAALDRGGYSEIGTLPGESFDSIFSGNTIELCPVGALTSRQYRFKARPWDLVRTPSVCNGCAVGCNVQVHSRAEQVLRLVSRENALVDDGWLCDRGRFGTIPASWDDRPRQPLVRTQPGGSLEPSSWADALARASGVLAREAGILASPALSNEALWLLAAELQPALGHPPMALWPNMGASWPVRGQIANLTGCKTIVLVGLDPWYELPVLALWIRRAVQHGARLVVIGAANGLFRDTADWLRAPSGWEARVAEALQVALGGGTPEDIGDVSAGDIARVAAALRERGAGPAALLVHPGMVEGARDMFEQLANALGATASTGLVGAPAVGANARGAQELAPALFAGESSTVLDRANGHGLLLLGDEAWTELDAGAARLVLATARPVPHDSRLEVVLPLAHPYERQGSVTNLEGRVQYQEGGAAGPPYARADWSLVADLAAALGARAPRDLVAIRAAMAREKPEWADLLAQGPDLRPFTSSLSLGISQGDLGHTGRAVMRDGVSQGA